jgi:hypothetical protein
MLSDTQPDLPSLTISALLVPLPFSSWLVRHSDVESAAQPSWMPDPTDDRRPYLDAPHHDALSEPIPFPAEEENSCRDEFSFRSAWEITRSIEHLPPAWRHVYRKWNRTLSEEHDLSMSAGGAHRYTSAADAVIHTPPTPPPTTVILSGMARNNPRRSAFRSALHRRFGIVRCPSTNRFARHPSSSWTAHGPLDRRVPWSSGDRA